MGISQQKIDIKNLRVKVLIENTFALFLIKEENTMKTTIETYPGVGNNTPINKRNRAAKAYSDSIKAKERAKAQPPRKAT